MAGGIHFLPAQFCKMTDHTFIKKLIERDASAFQSFYEDFAPYVYAIVKNYIFDEVYRKDVMQETFAALFLSVNNYDSSKASLKTWVSRIAVNQCINFLRKHYRQNMTFNLELYTEISDSNINALHALSREELEALLIKMPLGYRTIFLLSVIDEYDHKEIATMLNITQETSRSQLMRALTWIRNHIFNTNNALKYEFR